MPFASEDDLEHWALEELQGLGFAYLHGSALSPEAEPPARDSFRDVLLLGRLDDAIRRLNPHLPADAVRVAINEIRDTKFSGDLLSEKPPYPRGSDNGGSCVVVRRRRRAPRYRPRDRFRGRPE